MGVVFCLSLENINHLNLVEMNFARDNVNLLLHLSSPPSEFRELGKRSVFLLAVLGVNAECGKLQSEIYGIRGGRFT